MVTFVAPNSLMPVFTAARTSEAVKACSDWNPLWVSIEDESPGKSVVLNGSRKKSRSVRSARLIEIISDQKGVITNKREGESTHSSSVFVPW